MPTYEYECRECGYRFEVNQRISDDPLIECEVCGGPLRKLFHPVGIAFKGSGFYVTDNRGSRAKAPSSDGKKPEKKAQSATSESKEKTA
ncbi:MAG TPA: FmdB family zinc ribbon protein [Actinomycetota bacterium]